MSLMQRGLSGRHNIFTAFTRDALKGYVYIEALQSAAVQKVTSEVN
jgi:hypothetical protein